MAQYEFDCVYNLPYSPDYNGIEKVFSIVKRNYRKILQRKLNFDEVIVVKDIVAEAFDQLDTEAVKNCVKHGLKEIMRLGEK